MHLCIFSNDSLLLLLLESSPHIKRVEETSRVTHVELALATSLIFIAIDSNMSARASKSNTSCRLY